jgi:hypothetical protein
LIKGHPNRESEREIACDPNCCARGLKILIETERSFGNYNLVGGRLAREKNQPSSLSLQPVKREEKRGIYTFSSSAPPPPPPQLEMEKSESGKKLLDWVIGEPERESEE